MPRTEFPFVLTEAKIQAIMFKDLVDKGHSYIAPNTLALPYESDLLSITTSNRLYEYEIKISRSDFKADFNKKNKHWMYQRAKEYAGNVAALRIPSCFYYVVPDSLIRLEEVPPYAGLIYICDRRFAHIVKRAPKLHSDTVAQYVKDKIAVTLMWKVYTKILKGKGR